MSNMCVGVNVRVNAVVASAAVYLSAVAVSVEMHIDARKCKTACKIMFITAVATGGEGACQYSCQQAEQSRTMQLH